MNRNDPRERSQPCLDPGRLHRASCVGPAPLDPPGSADGVRAPCRAEAGERAWRGRGVRRAIAAWSLLAASWLMAADPILGPITFSDVTAAAGIRFKHNSGAFGKKYLPE